MARDGSHFHQEGDDGGGHTHEYGMLSDQTIKEFALSKGMIDPFQDEYLKGASYDLTVGREYYVYHKNVTKKNMIQELGKGKHLTIPPHGVCYVLTEETLNLPENVSARLSLRFGLIGKGIMLAAHPPIDPTYNGKIVALLYNLSNKEIRLRQGKHVVTVEFKFLDKAASQPYSGNYPIKKLEDFLEEPIKSALEEVYEEVDERREKLANVIPRMLFVISIIVAILTAFLVITGVGSFFFSSCQRINTSHQEQVKQEVLTEQVPKEVEVRVVLELSNTERLEETKQDTTASQEGDEETNK